jgi:predicted XRE-type DNA-binding protein
MHKNKNLPIIDEDEIDELIKKGTILPIHLPKEHTISNIIKYSFCAEIIRYKVDRNLLQSDIANLLKINKSEVSKLFSYQLEAFSQERIIGFVETMIQQGIEINLIELWEDIKQRSASLQILLNKMKSKKHSESEI